MNTGCRPFDDKEFEALLANTDTQLRALLSLGVRTGFRISELLSLTWRSVLNADGIVKDTIEVPRRSMKGKNKSRRMPLHPETKIHLNALSRAKYTGDMTHKVFPMDRSTAYRQLKKALKIAGIKEGSGRLATHSLRKTFARKIYEGLSRDLNKLSQALGHSRIQTTIRYLQVDAEEIENVIKSVK